MRHLESRPCKLVFHADSYGLALSGRTVAKVLLLCFILLIMPQADALPPKIEQKHLMPDVREKEVNKPSVRWRKPELRQRSRHFFSLDDEKDILSPLVLLETLVFFERAIIYDQYELSFAQASSLSDAQVSVVKFCDSRGQKFVAKLVPISVYNDDTNNEGPEFPSAETLAVTNCIGLKHPNIVVTHGFFLVANYQNAECNPEWLYLDSPEDVAYYRHYFKVRRQPWAIRMIVMEHIEGTVLSEVTSVLGLGQSLSIILQLAGAVRYLHMKNICHRGIKPRNIILKAVEHPVLIDFDKSIKLNDKDHMLYTILYLNGGEYIYRDPVVRVFSSDLYDQMPDEEFKAFRNVKWDIYSLSMTALVLLLGGEETLFQYLSQFPYRGASCSCHAEHKGTVCVIDYIPENYPGIAFSCSSLENKKAVLRLWQEGKYAFLLNLAVMEPLLRALSFHHADRPSLEELIMAIESTLSSLSEKDK